MSDDEIRQSEGFKNVTLNNVISSNFGSQKVIFVAEQDKELMQKWGKNAFEVQVKNVIILCETMFKNQLFLLPQVGLHELFGHGSGKLLIRDKNGECNFPCDLVNPLTGKRIDKSYEANETYDSKFSTIGSSYEECRAECVALYLSCYNDVVR